MVINKSRLLLLFLVGIICLLYFAVLFPQIDKIKNAAENDFLARDEHKFAEINKFYNLLKSQPVLMSFQSFVSNEKGREIAINDKIVTELRTLLAIKPNYPPKGVNSLAVFHFYIKGNVHGYKLTVYIKDKDNLEYYVTYQGDYLGRYLTPLEDGALKLFLESLYL